jgi:hypothetical protein
MHFMLIMGASGEVMLLLEIRSVPSLQSFKKEVSSDC